ncbi:hypothetical protein [Microbacterium enclense]|uniref:hypothetical protein n=1 Tax=Microbacterium enclense TaxID=993073 RepID=UPI003F81C6AC
MTEPQVWVLIGTFAAAVLGGMTFSTNLIMSSLSKVITANTDRLESRIDALRFETMSELQATGYRIDSLGTTLNARIDSLGTALNARIDSVEAGLNAKIDSVEAGLNAKIHSVETRLTAQMESVESRLRGDMARIDADVTAIAKRAWTEPPAT